VLPQDFQQSFFNLQRVDWNVVLLELIDFVFVQFHQLNIGVAVIANKVVVNDLVEVVDAVDVLHELVDDRKRASNRLKDQYRPTEVNSCLDQVLCRKMVVLKLTLIVALKAGFEGEDVCAFDLVEK